MKLSIFEWKKNMLNILLKYNFNNIWHVVCICPLRLPFKFCKYSARVTFASFFSSIIFTAFEANKNLKYLIASDIQRENSKN